jgi:hypothetical protein
MVVSLVVVVAIWIGFVADAWRGCDNFAAGML